LGQQSYRVLYLGHAAMAAPSHNVANDEWMNRGVCRSL